jgi:23S rRNA (pseudouridine1915-N3)-methyltransferase
VLIKVIVVGRARDPLDHAVAHFEERAARYWKLEVVEVEGGVKGKGKAAPAAVMDAEAERILTQIPPGATVVALTREGRPWSSVRLSRFLQECALSSVREVDFVVGGAFGLSAAVLERADRRLTLSSMTMPHELARLVLAEQLYRAGTIQRGEPYHKGADA